MNLSRAFFIFSIAVLSQLVSYAQHEYTFRFTDTGSHLSQNFYKTLRVIDERKDKENIGYLKTGAFNRTANIITEKSIGEMLSEHFERMQLSTVSGNDELLLVLYDMRIEDRPNSAEMGTFHFDGDFYSSNASGYAFLGKTDSIFEVQSKWDVSKKLIELVQYKVDDFFSMFAVINPSSVVHAKYADAEILNRRKKEKLAYPIYSTDSFKRGIYFTVDQFVNNEPSDTPFIRDVFFSGNRKYSFFYYPNEKGKKGKKIKGSDFFAIYYQGEWYSSGYDIMKYTDGDFYAAKRFKGVSNNSSAVVMGAMFGLIGALAAAATEGDGTGYGLYKAKFDPVLKEFVPFKRIY